MWLCNFSVLYKLCHRQQVDLPNIQSNLPERERIWEKKASATVEKWVRDMNTYYRKSKVIDLSHIKDAYTW